MWPLLDDNTVSLEPGACAQRQGGKSCELRDVIRSDLHKWADRSIRPAQLQYSFGTSKLDNKFDAGADYVDSKHWMYAAVHGRRVHFVTVGHEYGRHARTMQRMLLSLVAVAPLDDFELASPLGMLL